MQNQNEGCSRKCRSPFLLIEPSKPVINIPGNPTTIEAQDRSPITLNIGDNVTALTNTSITIQCHAGGAPTPTVTWTKDGQEIPSDGRYIVQNDGSLLIRESKEADNARYTCTADSVAGKDSASSTVQIAGKYSRTSTDGQLSTTARIFQFNRKPIHTLNSYPETSIQQLLPILLLCGRCKGVQL